MDNFDPLVIHMKAFCKNMASEFVGALLRPHADMLRGMVEMGAPIDDIFEAAKEAGRQLAADGVMSEQTLQAVSRELIPRDQYVSEMNEWVKQAQAKNKVS